MSYEFVSIEDACPPDFDQPMVGPQDSWSGESIRAFVVLVVLRLIALAVVTAFAALVATGPKNY